MRGGASGLCTSMRSLRLEAPHPLRPAGGSKRDRVHAAHKPCARSQSMSCADMGAGCERDLKPIAPWRRAESMPAGARLPAAETRASGLLQSIAEAGGGDDTLSQQAGVLFSTSVALGAKR